MTCPLAPALSHEGRGDSENNIQIFLENQKSGVFDLPVKLRRRRQTNRQYFQKL